MTTKKTTPDSLFTDADKKLIRKMVGEAPDHEAERFIRICERTGLDPFTRQIYGHTQRKKIKEQGKPDRYENTIVIITSIDGLRAISESSGKYRGQTKPEWYYVNDENVLGWHDVFIPKRDPKGNPITVPEAARVGIHKENFVEPCYGVANFDSFAQWYKGDGTAWELSKFWKDMPEHMIAKVAEAMGHRKAFPLLMGGLYIEEEIKDEEAVIPPRETVTVTASAPAPTDLKPGEKITMVQMNPPDTGNRAEAAPKGNGRKKAADKPAPTPTNPPAPVDAPGDQPPDPENSGTATPTTAPKTDGPPEWMEYALQVVKLPSFKGKKLGDLDLDSLEALKSGWVEMNAAKITGDPAREKERDMILAAFNARFDEMKAKK